MTFYQQGRSDGDFETGIQQALARILVAPRFLYPRRRGARGRPKPGAPYRVSNLDLASRLSFFLWSSIPDDELLDVASKGRLRDPTVLQQQVKRMLADPKSEALTENFAGQWLFLRELANVQTVGAELRRQPAPVVPHARPRCCSRPSCARIAASSTCWTPTTRSSTSGSRATTASRTFTAATSAGSTLPADSPRRGLLGQGSMLTVTSVATRTSPVSRGKWILENLLGAPPPHAAAGRRDEPREGCRSQVKITSLRQRLEAHRANPTCASCHKIMDPIGFALENFDLVGTWRDATASRADRRVRPARRTARR